MKKYFFILLLFFLDQTGFGVIRPVLGPTYLFKIPRGFVMAPLSGYGYSNCAINQIENISCCNPALINNIRTGSFGFSYQFESKTKNAIANEIQYVRENTLVPQSTGLVFQIKNFHLGIGYHKHYDLTTDYDFLTGTVVDTTSLSGYRDIGTFRLKSSSRLYKYAILFAFQKAFKTHYLQFGIQVNYYSLFHENREDRLNAFDPSYPQVPSWQYDYRSNKTSWALGVLYDSESLKLGIYYDKGCSFSGLVTVTGIQLDILGDIPDKFNIGFIYGLSEKLKLNFNSNYVIWWKTRSRESSVVNQLEYSGNLFSTIFPNTVASIGFYNSDYQFTYSPDDEQRSTYITVGFNFLMKNIQWDLCLADNRLFSKECRKQTILKLGSGITL